MATKKDFEKQLALLGRDLAPSQKKVASIEGQIDEHEGVIRNYQAQISEFEKSIGGGFIGLHLMEELYGNSLAAQGAASHLANAHVRESQARTRLHMAKEDRRLAENRLREEVLRNPRIEFLLPIFEEIPNLRNQRDAASLSLRSLRSCTRELKNLKERREALLEELSRIKEGSRGEKEWNFVCSMPDLEQVESDKSYFIVVTTRELHHPAFGNLGKWKMKFPWYQAGGKLIPELEPLDPDPSRPPEVYSRGHDYCMGSEQETINQLLGQGEYGACIAWFIHYMEDDTGYNKQYSYEIQMRDRERAALESGYVKDASGRWRNEKGEFVELTPLTVKPPPKALDPWARRSGLHSEVVPAFVKEEREKRYADLPPDERGWALFLDGKEHRTGCEACKWHFDRTGERNPCGGGGRGRVFDQCFYAGSYRRNMG